MNISIIGSGYVGTATGKGFVELGNRVIFYDVDKKKIEKIREEGFEATDDIEYAIKNSSVSFISVPTPSVNGKIDLSYIKSACESIAKCLKNKKEYHLIVVKSTVVPKTTEGVVKETIEKFSGKKCGKDFGLCMNPEFLTQIHTSWTNDPSASRDFFSGERIVIGEFDKKSGDVLEEIFKPLNKPIFRTDLKTAELIKYASNCALASRISYWNEIYYICEKIGVDSNFVAQVVCMDSRIGKYGSVHGKAFGGSCFPKDLDAFISFAEEIGYNPVFLKAVREINEKIKKDKGVRE